MTMATIAAPTRLNERCVATRPGQGSSGDNRIDRPAPALKIRLRGGHNGSRWIDCLARLFVVHDEAKAQWRDPTAKAETLKNRRFRRVLKSRKGIAFRTAAISLQAKIDDALTAQA